MSLTLAEKLKEITVAAEQAEKESQRSKRENEISRALEHIDRELSRLLTMMPQPLLTEANNKRHNFEFSVYGLDRGENDPTKFRYLPYESQIRDLEGFQRIRTYCLDNGLRCNLNCYRRHDSSEISSIHIKIGW